MYMYVHVRVYEWLQEVEELQAQLEPLKAQLASYQGLPPVSNHNCRYMYMYMYSEMYSKVCNLLFCRILIWRK